MQDLHATTLLGLGIPNLAIVLRDNDWRWWGGNLIGILSDNYLLCDVLYLHTITKMCPFDRDYEQEIQLHSWAKLIGL